ncbi:Transcriptional regulator containing GAF, AAA-type ATPase, and DNA-binding Fis domains [Desulfocicer vacuolatum DSM 3385]|uniref:Transcriptional regulator containing GAF, AAA-type ATPase, and DNA-binding Fis domains n=1 Tax=Desulfocicer vacuolatum DSM 3385 TaxID=1121400 RepID=A0A1W2CXY2_9BACT|nr:sigma 54-interacting transcriptional regulator [Desulfocicer vacuolatum]SMC89588.1 Transcriptional regulator containing GAF, AAA-type ATPase, and DNA-binding Fis domains [Desulfocicer vacuolatum DSM 3385]
MENFFRDATLAICGSLDIEDALRSCLLSIRKYIPADLLSLHLYKKDTGFLETVAYAKTSVGKKCSFKNKIPDNVMKGIERGPSRGAWLVERLGDYEGTREAAAYMKCTDMAGIIMNLTLGKKLLGVLVVAGKHPDQFSSRHLELLKVLNKPVAVALTNSMRHREAERLKDLLADDSRYFQSELKRRVGQKMIGSELGLKASMQLVQHVAPLNSPVLLLGETGVGKEIFAGAVHNLSPRKDGPMISFNCGAIPPNLIDSELFGYEKGAFTGAVARKRGIFERAQGGTIFLDEIGELAPDAQTRLLRVLQQKEIQRVGGTDNVNLDIRLIAATHRNLKKMMMMGTFREDLFFRLNVFPITIPPLRNRPEDIPALVEHFILEKANEMKLRKPPQVMPDEVALLMAYEWPGNIRELENTIERALILNKKKFLSFGDLQLNSMKELPQADNRTSPALPLPLDVIIANHIRSVLAVTKGKINGKGGAAELLSINPSTLRNRMKKLGIAVNKTVRQD